MGNMSYCRFENTARDLRDCVHAIHNGETDELNDYELEGLQEILDLAQEIMDDQDFIKEILNSYEENYE
tara:strand:+ start:458 stop:664 length:207 start_codon:yes stop_codon:yes gene_type:complete